MVKVSIIPTIRVDLILKGIPIEALDMLERLSVTNTECLLGAVELLKQSASGPCFEQENFRAMDAAMDFIRGPIHCAQEKVRRAQALMAELEHKIEDEGLSSRA